MTALPLELLKPIRAARRRLFLQSFGRWWIRFCALGALLLAIAVVAISEGSFRTSPRPTNDPVLWQQLIWLGLVVVGSFIPALLLAYLKRPGRGDIALAVDRHFQLKERWTTLIHLSEEEAKTPMGQALAADALDQAEKVQVEEAFPLRASRQAVLIPLTCLLCAGAILFFEKQSPPAPPGTSLIAFTEQEKKELKEKLEAIKKAPVPPAPEKKLPHEEIQAIEDAIKNLEDPPQTEEEAREMLKDMTTLADRLRKRSKEISEQQDALRDQFQDVGRLSKKKKKGPADKMQEAMGEGDMEKAQEEARRLSRKLAEDGLTPQERKELEEQLKDIQERLDRLTDGKLQREELQQMADQGKIDPKELKERLKQLQEQLEQMEKNKEQLQQLQQALEEAQQAMQEGDQKKAGEAMDKAAEQMAKLGKGKQQAQLGKQMQLLREAGRMLSRRMSNRAVPGAGRRPEAKDGKTGFEEEWVRGQRDKGKNTGFRWIPGMGVRVPTKPGEKKATIENAGREAAEALDRQYLPRSAEDMARGYFKRLRDEKEQE